VNECLDRPVRVHPLIYIGNENRIEINGGNFANRLLDDARAKRVSAADFEHTLSAIEHPRDKLISCQRK
jgi:hypothetical protein